MGMHAKCSLYPNSVILIRIKTGEVNSLRGSGQDDFVACPRFNPTLQI